MILKRLSASSQSGDLAKARARPHRANAVHDRSLRRRCQAGLNKGEVANKLRRAVFFHERGEIRDRSYDSKAFRASGPNLVVSVIVRIGTPSISAAQRPICANRVGMFPTSGSSMCRRSVVKRGVRGMANGAGSWRSICQSRPLAAAPRPPKEANIAKRLAAAGLYIVAPVC